MEDISKEKRKRANQSTFSKRARNVKKEEKSFMEIEENSRAQILARKKGKMLRIPELGIIYTHP
jgi:hypothetical protein